ncbi:hypothetical protein STENM223S_06737 [Streptomyces tendae]
MLYAAQILLLFVFIIAIKNTTLFNPQVLRDHFGRLGHSRGSPRRPCCAHMSKILYVEPEPKGREKPGRNRRASVRGRAGIKRHVRSPAIVRCQLRHRGRGHLG